MSIDEAWSRWRADGDVKARNEIVEHYLPMVEKVAKQLEKFLVSHADHAELVSAGTEGLLDAVAKFDPETSDNFPGFAWKRIKGEMIDQLRANDGAGRRARAADRRISGARDELTAHLGRNPSDYEIATYLGLTMERFRRHQEMVASSEAPMHLDVVVAEESAEEITLGETLQSVDDVEGLNDVEEIRAAVVNAWNQLPHRERTVLTLRYVQGLTLAQTGELLGVGQTRASRILSDALRTLRSIMGRM